MNKGRENNNKALIKPPSNDLLVCFPTRAHLTLMPKPTYSPSRPNSEPNKRHNHHLKRINTRAATSSGGGPGSPYIWAKDNQIRGGGPEMSEPTSPKVTCAGQIKVRPRSSNSCRNWQSVMEEIEKIHNSSKNKKKSSLVETFGFKKDVMNFLTCLRNVRFDFRCFGSFPQQDLSSDDEEEEEEEEEDEDDAYEEEDSFKEIIDEDYKVNNEINDNDDNNNNAVFSKWFMVLQENQTDKNDAAAKKFVQENALENDDSTPAIPPPNALLLMRCRSAPAKSWLEEKENEVKDDNEESEEQKVEEEEINKKKRETLAIVMKYDTDFYKLSNDVAQETWVVGEFKDTFSRSRSWRR